MKVLYDPGTDTLTVTLKEGVPVVESDEDKPGVKGEGETFTVEVISIGPAERSWPH